MRFSTTFQGRYKHTNTQTKTHTDIIIYWLNQEAGWVKREKKEKKINGLLGLRSSVSRAGRPWGHSNFSLNRSALILAPGHI